MRPHAIVSLEAVQAARAQIAGSALRTPLLRLPVEAGAAEIYLKLENLQPIGSFKLRGAANALGLAAPAELEKGVWTASAGNMAQGLAWCARRRGVPCRVVAPDNAPAVKLEAIRRLGAEIMQVPFADYQAIQRSHTCAEMEGKLIHPFGDEAVMAGNGTISLEILEDAPEIDTVIIPYGGGGLSCGMAAALRAVRPDIKVWAGEVAQAAPLAASLAAGRPVEVAYTGSFVSGMGAPSVFPEMWPLASQLLDGALVVEVAEVAAAVRLLAERAHVVAEGAGAVALAAALTGRAGGRKIACVVSGGNIDRAAFTRILEGYVPE